MKRWSLRVPLALVGILVAGQVVLAQGPQRPQRPQPPVQPPVESPEQEPDPEMVAQRCIRAMTHTAQRTIHHNLTTARQAVQQINRLLEAGNEQQARAVGLRALNRINRQSRTGSQSIREICRKCTAHLEELGADQELIDRVEAACEKQLQRVERSRRGAIQAIRNVLDLPEEVEDE